MSKKLGSERVLELLLSNIHKEGIEVIPTCVSPGKIYESFVFLAIAQTLLGLGFRPVHRELCDLNVENSMPYRQITRSSDRNLLVSTSDLLRILTPRLVLQRNEETLNLFYQGYPLGRGRQKPDVTVLRGRLGIDRVSSAMGEERIRIDYCLKDHTTSLVIRPICDTCGPVRQDPLHAPPIPPSLIVEISLRKPERHLKDQLLGYLSYEPLYLGYVTATKLGYGITDARIIMKCDGIELQPESLPRIEKAVKSFVETLMVA